MSAIDPNLCRLAVELVNAGDVVWDIGANVGLFAFSAAHLSGRSGRVFAFEADVSLVQILRRSCEIQPVESSTVTVVPTAIGGSCGLRDFNIANRSRATNFLEGYGSTQTGGVSERQTVVCLSLEWMSHRLPAPDLIKIDVEGAEAEVLEGAVDVLERWHPRVLCEVSSESSPKVTELLKKLGYEIYDGENPLSSRRPVQSAPWNTVAIADQTYAKGVSAGGEAEGD